MRRRCDAVLRWGRLCRWHPHVLTFRGVRYCSQYDRLRNVATRKNTPKPVRRAVGYVRISVDRDEETSTSSQEAAIRAWCAAQGVELVDVLVEPGRSAFKSTRASRPKMRKAMALIEGGAADAFVCWKLDRAARNTRDLLDFVHELSGFGAAFVSVTEQFDSGTPMGRVMMTIIAALAELESATKSERIEAWQDHRKATGATPTGPRPFGYRRERNRLIVDETEAAVIKRAAADVLAGVPLRVILRGFAADGIVTKTGRPFRPTALVAVLTGPTIAALRELDGRFIESDTWEPILDRTTWEDVRLVLLDAKRRSGPGPERRWLLSGLATCGRDGTAMITGGHRTGPRYSCPSCHMSIKADDCDEAVAAGILGVLDRRTWKRLRRRGRHVDTSALEAKLLDLAHQRAEHEITEEVWKVLNAGVMADIAAATVAPVALPDVEDVRAAWPDLPIAARRLVLAATATIAIREPRRGVNRFDSDRLKYDWIV